MTATSARSRLAAAVSALRAPIDASSLVVFRVTFGLLMVAAVVRFAAHGRIAEHYVEPARFFTYAGFGWVYPWPGAWMYVHVAAMGACALLVALGLAHRWAALGFTLLFAYAQLCDETHYLNHYYLIVLLGVLLALTPLGSAPRTLPAWVLWTFRGQLAVVYFFGGVAKLQPDWLLHAQPLEIWLAANAEMPVVGPLLAAPWVPYAASWGAALFDLTIPGWLIWRRSRPYAYAVAVCFHVLTAQLFRIGMFPWLMIALTPIFFAPDWPRRLWSRLSGRRFAPVVSSPPRSPGRAVGAVLGLHAALQVLVPLRFLLYPGYHLWTEQGFRFAWKVMVMEKSGVADFIVRDPDRGREWRVPATAYWTRYQAAMMATQPDMILEAAHVVADDYRRRGVRRPEVRADVFVSLNGRPGHRLIDPAVDLAAERFSLAPFPWILPAPDVDPP